MRPRVIVVLLLAACGPGAVEAPPHTVPIQPREPTDEDGFMLDPQAPYAKLFEPGATWTLPTTIWIGPDAPPTVQCAIGGVQRFPAARVAKLTCTASRALGPTATALPAYGVVATDDGFWITSNAGVIEAPPSTTDHLTTLLATQPMRLAVKPVASRVVGQVEHPGPIHVTATVDAAPRGDAWCLTDENAAGSETVTAVLCLRAGDGLVGATIAYRSHGIVVEALGWGDAPPAPPSTAYQVETPPQVEEVTLDNPGKGKRTPLELTATVGTEQQIEYVIDGRTRAANLSDPATPPIDQARPTVTLRGAARVESIDPDGTLHYRFTLADAVLSGAGATPEGSAALKALDGMVYDAAVGKDGRVGRRTIRVERPTAATPAMVAQIAQSMSTFTVLPTKPVGVGAKWTARSPGRFLDRDVQVTVRSHLAERTAGRAVIVSEASIVPFEQPVGRGTAKVSAKGSATMQTVIGALIPMRTYDFTLTVVVEPTDPKTPREQRDLLVRIRVLPK